MSRSFDAVVAGAGIAGVATAYYLSQAGHAVALVDAHHPGWGASGRNPGFLWLQTKAAGLPMHFSLTCRAFAATLPERFGDFGFRACGGLIVYREEAYAAVADAFVADRRAAGLAVEHIDRGAVLELCPETGPEVSGAIYNPLDAHQDTRALLRLLVEAFEAAGGIVVAPARVAALDVEGGRCRGIRLADGSRIAAGTVVVAAGPWSNEILAPHGLAIPYHPVRFEAAATPPAPFRIGPVVAGQALFRFFVPPGVDAEALPRDPSQTLRPELGFTEQIASQPDGSIQFGCAYEPGSMLDQATVAGQAMACAILSRNFPALAGLPVARQWAGIVAQTPDGLPFIEAETGIDGVVINSGHFFGNLAGAFSGKLVAQLMSGEVTSYLVEAFRTDRHARHA